MNGPNAVLDALQAHATMSPTSMALVGDDETIDHAALWQRVTTLSRWLRQQDVACAGLWGENGIAWIVADLAAWHAGVPLVPLPAFFSQAQLAHVIESTGLTHVITCDGIAAPATVRESVASPIAGIRLDLRHRGDGASGTGGMIPSGICKVTFTSGTTGQPKGVCLTTAMIEGVARALVERIHGQHGADALDRHFTVLPLGTLLENVAGVYVPILLGRSVHVRAGAAIGLLGSSNLDVAALLRALHEAQPASLILLPQILRALVLAAEGGMPPPASLRFVAVGGAATSTALLLRAQSLGIPVFEGYGLSECASVVALNAPLAQRVGSVGRVLDHVRVRIQDGAILVAGNVFPGYLGQPDSPGGEWLDTGDLGHIDADGFLHVTGRRKNVLISSFGRNISPEWVEAELALCPSIAQVMAIGDAQPCLGAIVVPAQGAGADAVSNDISSVNAGLPDYARIVRVILAATPFTVDNGALTDNGRLRRDVIATRHAAQIAALYDTTSAPPKQDSSMTFFETLQQKTQAERDGLLSAPLIQRCLHDGHFRLEEYIGFLTEAFHHVRHTVPLLMAVGSRLPMEKESFRSAIAEYIEEELGHQEWILNDLAACGADAEAVRHGQPNAATELMVAYAYDTVMRRNPMGFFGMVFVLEGTSINLATRAADIIQQRLGLPDKAFSYLRSHGSLDQEHMAFFERLMNDIDDVGDRDDIVHAARRFFRLYGDIFRTIDADSAPAAMQQAA